MKQNVIEIKAKNKQEAVGIGQGFVTLLSNDKEVWEAAVKDKEDSLTTGLYDLHLCCRKRENEYD